MKNTETAVQAALKACDKGAEKFKRKIENGWLRNRHSYTNRLIASVTVRDLYHERSLANNFCRRTLIEILARALIDNHAQDPRRNERRYFLGTFCFDPGIVECGHYLDLDFDPIQKKVRKALERLGLNAICAPQVDILTKNKLFSTEHFLGHIHTISWTYDPKFRPKKRAKELSKSRSFPNRLGAPSVTFVSRRQSAANWKKKSVGKRVPPYFRNLRKDQNAASLARLAYYAFSPPAYAKNLVISRKPNRRNALRTTEKNYTSQMAVGMAECLSGIDALDGLFGVREGKYIRREVRRGFKRARDS